MQSEIELGPFQRANVLEDMDHAYGNSAGPESRGKAQTARRDNSLNTAWKLDSIKSNPLELRKEDNQPAGTPASQQRVSRPLASAVL